VVAHSMTVVAVQAGFGEYVFDHQPAQARAALGAIQTVTREALCDMQRLLGVLRQAEPAGYAGAGRIPAGSTPEPGPVPVTSEHSAAAPVVALAPAPGLADLARLVSGTAGAGVQVEVRQTGHATSIPASIDLSAFRIVQEALTNVVRHSGADTCLVSIDYGEAALSLEITDPGQANGALAGVGGEPAGRSARARLTPGPGAGHGIAGMRERVSLCGGDFAAGPLPERGYRVAASLPLPGRAR
jgi:signal transduction histidine kinase